MKSIKLLTVSVLTAAFLGAPVLALAGDAKAAADSYPLTTCVVSGEKLGEMGKAYTFKYKGEEVHLCCKDCLKDFNKSPEKYLKKLHDAQAAKAK